MPNFSRQRKINTPMFWLGRAAGRTLPSGWNAQRRRMTRSLLIAPLLVMTLLFVVPLLRLILLSIHWKEGLSLTSYAALLEPAYWQLFASTLELSIAVTLLCLILSYPIAYVIAHVRSAVIYWIASALLITLWLSTLARTYGWIILLQRNGVINDLLIGSGLTQERLSLVYNWTGVYIGMVHILMPFMIVTLIPALRAIDENLIRAALSLGASPRTVFLKVYFPLSLPGVISGSILVFVIALGFFTTPAILGGGRVTTIVMAIRDQVQTLVDLPLASATSVILLGLTLLVLGIYEKVVGVDSLFRNQR